MPNVQKRECNVCIFQLSFHFAYHRWWLGHLFPLSLSSSSISQIKNGQTTSFCSLRVPPAPSPTVTRLNRDLSNVLSFGSATSSFFCLFPPLLTKSHLLLLFLLSFFNASEEEEEEEKEGGGGLGGGGERRGGKGASLLELPAKLWDQGYDLVNNRIMIINNALLKIILFNYIL